MDNESLELSSLLAFVIYDTRMDLYQSYSIVSLISSHLEKYKGIDKLEFIKSVLDNLNKYIKEDTYENN